MLGVLVTVPTVAVAWIGTMWVVSFALAVAVGLGGAEYLTTAVICSAGSDEPPVPLLVSNSSPIALAISRMR